MFRIGLTVYLAVATLAGPSLCCCTMDRTFVSALDAIAKVVSGKSASSSHCCCATTCANEARKEGHQPPHEPGKCPCKEKGSRPAVPPTERVEVSQHNLAAEFVANFAAATFGLEVLTASAPCIREQSQAVHISGQDILLAFQTFRC